MSSKFISTCTYLIAFVIIFTTTSCAQQTEKKNVMPESKSQPPYQSMPNKIEDLKKTMTHYMDIAHPSYTAKDIDKCTDILTQYLNEIAKTHSKEEGMAIVKATILKLNALNDKCNGDLIETDERERIADIIIQAGKDKGYNSEDEDITEKWREW